MENTFWPGWQTNGLLRKETDGDIYEIQKQNEEIIEKAALKVIPVPQDANAVEQLRQEGYTDEEIARRLEKQAGEIAVEYAQGRKADAGKVSYSDIHYLRNKNGIGGRLLIKMALPASAEKAVTSVAHDEKNVSSDVIRIRFLLSDGRVISERTYQPGEQIVMPRMRAEILSANAKYVFKGWSAEVSPVAVQSADYVARYQKVTAAVEQKTVVSESGKEKQHQKKNLGIWAVVIAAVVVIALLATLIIGFKDRIWEMFDDPFSLSDSDRDDDDDRDDRKPHKGENDDAPATIPPVAETECSHDWQDATCTEPQVCANCGEVQGSALGHDWALATRTAPKTCLTCGATEGAPIPAPDISVGNQVQYVSDVYAEIENMLYADQLRREEVRTEVYYYYDSYGDIRMVVTAKGNDGLGEYSDQYRRYYYFDNDQLVFAYFEGQDCHRMYFYEGQLMRWRYQGVGQSRSDAVNEDFTYSDEFLKWESLALQEVKSFGVI